MPLSATPIRSACRQACALACALLVGAASAQTPRPATTAPTATTTAQPAPTKAPAQAAPAAPGDPGAVVERIRAALAQQASQNRLHVLVGDDPITPPTLASPAASGTRSRSNARHKPAVAPAPARPAAAPAWAYAGPNGPEHWGQLHPDYSACASGQRQAPIRIDPATTLQGPAETLQVAYGRSGGGVRHTGHTLRVDVTGTHTLSVRGSHFALQHLQFHHPAEIRIGEQTHAMAAHLLHRSPQGQTAVLVLPLEPGEAHPEIHKLWTHMPLEANDRVPMPDGLLDLQALLPQDPRYYQFMGSLSEPPCTEGVLWLVMKQPVRLSPEQLRLFAQLFPMNARPVQALNDRVVREAM